MRNEHIRTSNLFISYSTAYLIQFFLEFINLERPTKTEIGIGFYTPKRYKKSKRKKYNVTKFDTYPELYLS